jgi:Domain of unknown function (DUF1905)
MAAFIGGRVWKTPVFPDSNSGCRFPAVKAGIPKQAKIAVGDAVAAHLVIDIS